MSKDYILLTTDNEKLQITKYSSNHGEKRHFLIFVHGFKGFKDWGFVPYTCENLSRKGYHVISFNFSYNGIGENPTEFTQLDKFSKNTFSREIRELKEVIDACKNNFFGDYKNSKIGLIGHSRGGAISILTARKNKDVSAVAAWASVAKLDRYTKRQKDQWRKKGYFEIINQRTKQKMNLDITILDDIEKNLQDSLNMKKALEQLKIPLLIAHGSQDLSVSIEEAQQLYALSRKELTEYFIINNTGHTFNAKHPFEGSNDKLERLLEKTSKFFDIHLT